MASTQVFVDFIVTQAEDAGYITYRKMFGEYALYCDGQVVAFVCDDQLLAGLPQKRERSHLDDNIT